MVANIKSAIKRAQLAKARNIKNAAEKSAMRTAIRRFEEAVSKADTDLAAATLQIVTKQLDKAARKGLIHYKAAARKKSRLTKKLNALAG